MPIANTENCYRGSSHLLYVSVFTAMKSSIVINSDYNSDLILQNLKRNSTSLLFFQDEQSKNKELQKLGDLQDHKLSITLFL